MFGERLKIVRNQAGLSQKSLAEQLYVTQQSVWKWEMNESSPNPETVAKIAEIFNVSADYLLGITEQKEKPTPEDGGGQDDPLRTILLHNFDQLNQEGREKLVDISDDMVSSGKYIKSDPAGLGKAPTA